MELVSITKNEYSKRDTEPKEIEQKKDWHHFFRLYVLKVNKFLGRFLLVENQVLGITTEHPCVIEIVKSELFFNR